MANGRKSSWATISAMRAAFGRIRIERGIDRPRSFDEELNGGMRFQEPPSSQSRSAVGMDRCAPRARPSSAAASGWSPARSATDSRSSRLDSMAEPAVRCSMLSITSRAGSLPMRASERLERITSLRMHIERPNDGVEQAGRSRSARQGRPIPLVPPRKSRCSSATSNASRVFPTPPAPTRVTRRCPARSSAKRARARPAAL